MASCGTSLGYANRGRKGRGLIDWEAGGWEGHRDVQHAEPFCIS